ncbi:fibronectin type III domain-containing protein [Deminuibacter soli]|nr:hypothetical protein [Deminuibacter soli]
MRKTVATGMLLWILGSTVAQAQENGITALASARKDRIVLRWVPTSFVVWQLGSKYGYKVERFTIARDGKLLLTDSINKPSQPVALLEPYTQMQMDNLSRTDDKVAIVREMIYGEGQKNVSPDKGIGAFLENRNIQDWRMGMALLACDFSNAAARSAALYYEDKNVRPGERYGYRISVARQPVNAHVDSTVVVASPDEPSFLPPPREFRADFTNGVAVLSWYTAMDKGIYSAYIIERSTDGKNYAPVSELPVMPVEANKQSGDSYYKDSLADNETHYYYRIKGLTPFAETGPYSKIVDGQGLSTLDRPIVDSIGIISNKTVYLQWLMPASLKGQVAQIQVTRAPAIQGPYTQVNTLPLNTTATQYIDQHPLSNAYYRLKVVTKRKQTVYSFPYFAQLIDTIAPAKPEGLAATIDSAGIVQLHWASNKESDLQGYRVFRANAATEEFTEVTQHICVPARYADTVNIHTLTKKVYYKIIAVDKMFNTSPYTDSIVLNRPDIIPPAAPLMTSAVIVDSLHGIQLQWNNSSSDDAVRYALLRTSKQHPADTIKVAAWDSAHVPIAYTDTALVMGSTYSYQLQVWDDAGNSAAARSHDVLFENGRRPMIQPFAAAANRDKKTIELNWQCNRKDVKHFVVYRSKSDTPFILFATLPEGTTAYTDKAIFIGNTYRYKVKAVLQNDLVTEMSKVAEVKF